MTHIDSLRKRAQELKPAEIEQEIKVREEWKDRCIGQLYASMLSSEIWELKAWLAAASK